MLEVMIVMVLVVLVMMMSSFMVTVKIFPIFDFFQVLQGNSDVMVMVGRIMAIVVAMKYDDY